MTLQIIYEDLPAGTDPELAAWLQRQILQIQDALEQRLDVDSQIALDEKPQNGMFRYMDAGPEGPGFYGRVSGVWVRFGISGDVLIGYYDQVADLVTGGPYDGLPLPAPTDAGLQDRQYMILTANGAFATTHPDLVGKTGNVGDIIRIFQQVWRHENTGSAYLSSITDDTAQGHITLVKTPIIPGHAAQLSQVTAVQNNLDVHIGQQTNPDDVHGSKTYTDSAIAAHEAKPDPHPQYQRELPGYVLYGTCNNFTLDTTAKKLQGYADGAYWNDTNNYGGINQTDGEITIPWTGIFKFTAWVYGLQGNDNKEEWIELRVRTNGIDEVTIDVLEVPTDKTDGRSLKVSGTRAWTQGDVISIWLWASTGLGTFDFQNTTFELVGIVLPGWVNS